MAYEETPRKGSFLIDFRHMPTRFEAPRDDLFGGKLHEGVVSVMDMAWKAEYAVTRFWAKLFGVELKKWEEL